MWQERAPAVLDALRPDWQVFGGWRCNPCKGQFPGSVLSVPSSLTRGLPVVLTRHAKRHLHAKLCPPVKKSSTAVHTPLEGAVTLQAPPLQRTSQRFSSIPGAPASLASAWIPPGARLGHHGGGPPRPEAEAALPSAKSAPPTSQTRHTMRWARGRPCECPQGGCAGAAAARPCAAWGPRGGRVPGPSFTV